MSDTLLIHYNIEDKEQASWALCNSADELTSKICTGPLNDLSELASSHHCIVLLNSQCLHINQLQLPTQNLKKLLKAIPFAVEEFIADDIENIHFVITKSKTDTGTIVVGINKTTLQAIINNFEAAGISVDKIIPDALCLSANDNQWVALNYQDTSYLQTNTLNGTLVSHDILSYVVDDKQNNKTNAKPEKLLLFTECENTSAFSGINFDNTASEVINVTYNNHPLIVFCGNYKQASPLNLLQHDFKVKSKTSGYFRPWRFAAALACIWLTSYLGLTTYQLNQLKENNLVAENEITKIYKTAFPKSRKINNPRRQMEQKLNELKGASINSKNGLLFILENTFSNVTMETKQITFQSITFRNDRMDIGLDSKTLQAIETLNAKLNTNSTIKSEISSSSSEKDKVKGNLRIEARS